MVVKDSIKNILKYSANKHYTAEVQSKIKDYDLWIAEAEDKECIDGVMISKSEKSLTIDKGFQNNESQNEQNDTKLAEFDLKIPIFTVSDDENASYYSDTMVVLNQMNWSKSLEYIKNGKIEEKLILVLANEGKLNSKTIPHIFQTAREYPSTAFLYGDEDVLSADKRTKPWLKPDWSPDTFLSHFYIGSMLIFRTESLRRFLVAEADGLWRENQQDVEDYEKTNQDLEENDLYFFLYRYLKFHGAFAKHPMEEKERLSVAHISHILFHTYEKSGYDLLKESGRLYPKFTVKKPKNGECPLVSVIIPSKDHPDILDRCLETFIQSTTNDIFVDNLCKIEFIIVDNGSTGGNRIKITEMLQKIDKFLETQQNQAGNTCYLYKNLPFNFSFMCNWGAKEANGDYLLFLNDDISVPTEGFLHKLLEKAMEPYAGAVGCKLLYPDTDVIQHAGITNLRVGPAHKLQFGHDGENHYFGRNEGVWDCLGVTGACLLVSKEKFSEVNGFDEELAVAFNDVDLCYKLYENGYYNIVRNDMFLYHHESLSRGNDGESTEKQQRLLREKDALYLRHQELYGKDPFYHRLLTTDMLETEYSVALTYSVRLDREWAEVWDCTEKVAKAREDRCLRVGMEAAFDIYKWRYGVVPQYGKAPALMEDLGYYFQGYSFVIGSDNACYERTLLLKNTSNNRVFGVKTEKVYRPDIKANLKDQINVDLTGYSCKMKRDAVPEGTYRFGMLVKDKTSRQMIVNWSSWLLEVEE